MIETTKLEKMAVLEVCPDAYFIRTMKQCSDRHKYYMEEDPKVLEVLWAYRKSLGKIIL